MTTVITFGTFDLFHIGHLRIFERAAKYGQHLIVGVSSDQLNYDKKSIYPTYNERDRMQIVAALQYVDEVFLEESLEKKKDYIVHHKANILVMGDDWAGKFDWVDDVCEVVYLPRTKNISTTQIKDQLKEA